MKKPVLKLTIAAAITAGAFSFQAAAVQVEPVYAQQPVNVLDHKIVQHFNVENVYQNIDYLSKEPRIAGTESEEKAVQYIQSQFQSYGYETEIQSFTFLSYTEPESIFLSIEGSDETFTPAAFTYTVSGGITGELAVAGLGKKEELAELDLTGKIALIQRGEISFAEKVLNAAEKGAAGVIIYNNTDGALNGTLGEANDAYVPAVSLTKAEGEALAAKAAAETLTASLTVEGASVDEKTSHNVIAVKKPANQTKATNDIIVVGAHHDSVPGAPGANDDASGSAMTLELARLFKDIPTDTELRFITFGAEEVGLLGSEYYVDGLPEEEVSRMIANFNLDMVGSRDAGDLVMMTADGEPNLVTELAQASSTRLNGEAIPYLEGGRSDHVPFAEAGVPAALFIHDPAEPWYHTPDDTIDKISKEKLQDVGEIVGTAIYEKARFDNQGIKVKKASKVKVPHLYHNEDIQ
ncbi:M28 family peptidase [Domibacillus indicus]|uniref:M28 family peptidase n=1 Tax=Domibacillus indicus TaxID=1437523 RepID=UPI00203B0B21|nr:M28 family peptidase [Domibacillus indicus]MCM3789577.1 M28 family peptidase [Domibacillus indicus]